MAQGRFISYIRVSTSRQGASSLGLEAQQKAVRDYLNGGSSELVGEFVEIESGKRSDRPQLAEAMAACKREKATLVIAKIDRLARNVAFIANLMESGIEFVAVDMPHANKLTLHILSAVAEHEREMISARTKAALEAAKARGTKLGGRRDDAVYERMSATRSAQADAFAANVKPIIADIQRAGVTSYSAIADALNARGVSTRRGGRWHTSQVRNIALRDV